MSTLLSTPSAFATNPPKEIIGVATANQLANGSLVAIANFTLPTGALVAVDPVLSKYNTLGGLFQVEIVNVTNAPITASSGANFTIVSGAVIAANESVILTAINTAPGVFSVYIVPGSAGSGGGGGPTTIPVPINEGGTNSTTPLTGQPYDAITTDLTGTMEVESKVQLRLEANNNLSVGKYAAAAEAGAGLANTFVTSQVPVVTTGTANTFVGRNAGLLVTTGGDNTALGNSALATTVAQNNNTAVGQNAGSTAAGHGPVDSTFLGADTSAANDLVNATALGFGATVNASNALVLGSGVAVGIGLSTPDFASNALELGTEDATRPILYLRSVGANPVPGVNPAVVNGSVADVQLYSSVVGFPSFTSGSNTQNMGGIVVTGHRYDFALSNETFTFDGAFAGVMFGMEEPPLNPQVWTFPAVAASKGLLINLYQADDITLPVTMNFPAASLLGYALSPAGAVAGQPNGTAKTSIVIAASAGVVGDTYDFYCDGNFWFMRAVVQDNTSLTFA